METNIICDVCGYENYYVLPINGETIRLICNRCKSDLGYIRDDKDGSLDISVKYSNTDDHAIAMGRMWDFCAQLTKNDHPDHYQEIAKEIGDLVSKKQLQYGDSFGKSSKILEVLYPNGISVNQYTDALAIVRVIDKLFRISTGNQGDEDAWSDICGYSLLSIAKNMRKE